MVHLDLFSGIGGFAYAVDKVWDNAEHIFCDNDPFCRQVLRKHWKDSIIYEDIRNITNAERKGWGKRPKSEKKQIAGRDNRIDLLTGGFPCQPFSAAGNRRGTSDDRYLWPEMLRVIRLAKPQWVIAENVRGLLTLEGGMVFEQVCLDLEASGYEVQPFIIPAVAVNAPHRRDRIWFVAYRTDDGRTRRGALEQQRQGENDQIGSSKTNKQIRERRKRVVGKANADAQDPLSQRSRGRNEDRRQVLERQSSEVQDERPDWQSDWLEVATELCSVDDGLSAEVGGFTLTKAQHRVQQLKAYGNAIVPQVAIEIMKGMKL